VELIVSNRSRDAALVVHSIFLDYSQWLLSGTSNRTIPACPPPAERGKTAQSGAQTATTLPECVNRQESWQAYSQPNQIAATEYRIPRGQLLDAQQWSARNLAVRGLETLGSLAAGYVFAFKEPGIAKGVAAFNGNFLPAFRYLFPDSAYVRTLFRRSAGRTELY